jgi:adenine phosphoribosyltransferase
MEEYLKKKIRTVKDFPIKGILFRDITTLLKDPDAMRKAKEALLQITEEIKPDKIACIDSRGFIFGGIIADKMGIGFIPLRKPGKLPAETYTQSYQLEYGEAELQMHVDAINPGDRIMIHDDLLATGGTAQAACRLIEKAGGEVVLVSFLVELHELKGRERLHNYLIHSVINYA